jgi:RNA polymerase sigma-70 factor (ECF subfamily)
MLKDRRDGKVGDTAPGTTASSLSPSLLARLRAQDGDAWQRLVDLYGTLVYGWCRRRGLRAADAADVGQEVFAGVARGIADFRRDRPGDSFRGWLWGIAQHKLADYWRDRERRLEAEGGSDALRRLAEVPGKDNVSSHDETASGETGALLHRALELVRPEFEERTWQAFWRVTVAGQAPADVARELGTSPNAVYIARSRVLGRLRAEFADLID